MHDGAMDMAGRARAKIAEILASHSVPELDDGILQQLDEIVETGSKQALASQE
jgi:trimethylamine:corrinoid methyltransferase-like protein